jgi:hypothetical protein
MNPKCRCPIITRAHLGGLWHHPFRSRGASPYGEGTTMEFVGYAMNLDNRCETPLVSAFRTLLSPCSQPWEKFVRRILGEVGQYLNSNVNSFQAYIFHVVVTAEEAKAARKAALFVVLLSLASAASISIRTDLYSYLVRTLYRRIPLRIAPFPHRWHLVGCLYFQTQILFRIWTLGCEFR